MKHSAILFFFCLGFIAMAQNNFNYLDINNVKAGISNDGTMHYVRGSTLPAYEVPAGSGKHSDYVTGLWIGAYDNNNALHLAAQTYRQSGDDFWPGPLDTTNATITPAVSSQYNKLWKLNRTDITAFISNFNNGNVQNGTYIPPADLLSWPAKGTGAQSRNLAPYRDVNNNQVYDPLVGGDYPIIKGDQSLYYIFNDQLSHGNTGGTPLKVEVHATAYAYGNSATASQYAFLNNATFYNYKIINRSGESYHDAFVTLWADVDLGYYADDYVGCDVKGNYGFVYNGDSNDETVGGINGYGTNIPAAGYQVLKGPLMTMQDSIDNDNDGIIDEACEQQLMSRFNYFNNGFSGIPVQQLGPINAAQYYSYMSGYWSDNTPFTCGGNAFGGTNSTPFVYPGTSYANSPCGLADWTEISAGNITGDRRYMIGIGPFDFAAGSTKEIEYVHCTSFPMGSATALSRLKTEMQMLRNFSDVYDPVACVPVSLNELNEIEEFNLYPNPATSTVNLSFAGNTTAGIEVTNVYGKTVWVDNVHEQKNVSIYTAGLSAGIYFVKITSGEKTTVKKFIKQ